MIKRMKLQFPLAENVATWSRSWHPHIFSSVAVIVLVRIRKDKKIKSGQLDYEFTSFAWPESYCLLRNVK